MSTISPYANSSLTNALQDIQQKYKTADTSENGTLSQTEVTTAAQGGNGKLKATEIATAFKQMDADGNGELSKTELADGIKLASDVQQALVVAQEIMSGSMLLGMMGGGSGASSAGNMPSSGSVGMSNDYSSGFAEIIANTYKATEEAAAETPATKPTTTTA